MSQSGSGVDGVVLVARDDSITIRKAGIVAILLSINILNYMDRFTIAGVLGHIQEYFDIDDSKAGILQTMFIVFYLIFAPLFGVLGDRWNRKFIITIGLSIWIVAVFASSYVGPNLFGLFLLTRGFVGIGEASYATIAPTLIADVFTGSQRSSMLMIFYFAIPVGSGLGYIGGSRIALWSDSWQWGVRFTPVLGIALLLMLLLFFEEPKRGQAEHAEVERTSVKEDLRYLMNIHTFKYTTLGFTCVIFAVGAIAWFAPRLMGYAWGMEHGTAVIPKEELANVSLYFGVITCLSGIFGVVLGSTIAQMWREGRWLFTASHKADAYVCAIGAMFSVPFLFLCLMICEQNMNFSWFLMFLGELFICLNWAVNMDILMSVVVPNRRATATAIQTMISHLFGDASSPYIVGLVSDALRGNSTDIVSSFYGLRDALLCTSLMIVMGSGFYLASSFYLEAEQRHALRDMKSDLEVHYDDDDLETLVRSQSEELDTGAEPGDEASA